MTWAIDLAILKDDSAPNRRGLPIHDCVSLIARHSQHDRDTAFSEVVIFICQRCKLGLQRGAVKVDRPSGGDEFESETTVMGASCLPEAWSRP